MTSNKTSTLQNQKTLFVIYTYEKKTKKYKKYKTKKYKKRNKIFFLL